MRKKVIAILLTVTMTAAMLAGCGNSGSASDSSTEPVQEENTEEPATEGDSATAEEAETAESEAGGEVKSKPAAL